MAQKILLVYLQVQNYPRARHYILKVLIDCSPSAMPINALNTYGLILDGMGDYDQAIRVHRYVLYHAIKKKDVIMELGSYSNLAKVYYNKKDYDKAHFYLNKSDHVALKNDFHYGIDFNRIARSNVFLKQNRYKEAYLEVNNLETLVMFYNDVDLLKDFYNIMYQTQLELEHVDLAKSYFDKFLIYEAKTSGKELNILLGEQEIENQKIANQAVVAAIDQERLKDFYVKIALSLALFALLVLLLLVIIYGAKKREKISLEGIIEKNNLVKALEAKSKELLTESIKNLSIDTVKENIKTDLELLVDELPERQRELFKPFLKQLSKNERNQYIEEFESRFLGVYESFYDKLRELIPDLSPAEAKFCAFIKLNFTTKEISFITNRSPRTIDNTRSRIRKKLVLETDVNLHTFFADL